MTLKSSIFTNTVEKYKKMYLLTGIIIASISISFIVTYFINYYRGKNSKLQELILIVNNSCYHIHHSITLTLMMVCLLVGRYIKNNSTLAAIFGIYIGMVAEDFLYKDWYLIKNNCHKKLLLKFVKDLKSNTIVNK